VCPVIEAPARRASVLVGLARLFDPRPYVGAIVELARLVVRDRVVTFELTKRELTAEHSGKALGTVWGIIQPLALLGIYALIYGIVFRTRIESVVGGLPRNYTVYILSGLVPWFAFQFLMAKSATVIVGNAHLVKQVVFDVRQLPIATTLASSLALVLGLAFLALYTFFVYDSLPATYVLLPVLLVLQLLAMLGVAYFLAAVGVFFKDVRDIVQLSAIVLIFLLPIVYLPSQVPAAFDPILWLNPFSYMIWCWQDVHYFGSIEHRAAWFIFPAWTIFVLAGGFRVFRRLRPFFANVL
jgi:lipopolysaccharide transport system permease protein